VAKGKKERRGGRKKNEWTKVKLETILGFLKYYSIKQKDFAAHLGVTNSTFHNWKNGKCAPDEEVQVKIQDLIANKETITVAKKKAKTAKSRAPRGAGSSTLAALTGSTPKTQTKKKTKKKTAKASKKAKAKKKAKKRGRVVRTAAKADVPETTSVISGWNEIESLGNFLKANPDRSAFEVSELISNLQAVARLLG
jgi:DNA-binding XRE family transcriptional regulator